MKNTQSTIETKIEIADPVWARICDEAKEVATSEPALRGFIHTTVLNCDSLEQMLAAHLSEKLGSGELPARPLVELFHEALTDHKIKDAMRADIVVAYERDPACKTYLDVILYYKGYLALQTHRAAHWLINHNRRSLALYLQNRISEIFQVDIHPAAQIGKGVFIDHATGIVIGETAIIGDDVSMLHGVTLGGSGKQEGDRHPKIGDGVLISVGAKVLGNIRVGKCAKIGAGSVVLTDVPAHATAVGVPAKVVSGPAGDIPARDMDHRLSINYQI